MFFQTKCSRYIPPYDREDKNSGGSIRTNHPANDVLSVLSCHVETVCLLSKLNTERPETMQERKECTPGKSV